MQSLDDIRGLITESKTKLALEALQQWAESHLPEQRNTVDLLLARFHQNAQAFVVGTVSMEDYQVEVTRINQGVLTLIDAFRAPAPAPGATAAAPAPRPALHEYHAHTCDRVSHSDTFRTHFAGVDTHRVLFYYLYGGDLQSHEGFFRRTAYHLEGRLEDYLSSGVAATRRVLQLEMTFEFSRQPELYKQNILRSFFTMLKLPPNEHEPLLTRDLCYVLDQSPLLKGMSADDFVCVYLHISEYHWDAALTPAAARWFIREFCEAEPAADRPRFLFFFAIEYEEDHESIRDQVRTALEQSDYVLALPELDMVEQRDIALWLETYKQLAPGTRERKTLLKDNFPDEEHYMEDVELALRRIIDQYNNRIV